MANETLLDAIAWKTYEVAAGLASGHVPVRIGTAGNGGPVGVLVASVHGDEGPWSTIAINRMLSRAKASELTGTLRVVPVAHPLATEADARVDPAGARELEHQLLHVPPSRESRTGELDPDAVWPSGSRQQLREGA